MLELAYRARRPVLLEGPTGIGKSDVVRHVAAKLGARGEQLIAPSASSIAALAYLVVFGSMLAYSAFGYLLRNTRPALATSYAYVNPVMALALGVALAGERVTRADLFGLALVLAAVALVALGSRSAQAKASGRLQITDDVAHPASRDAPRSTC